MFLCNSPLCHFTNFLLFSYSSIFFSSACPHLWRDASIAALFHSPPLQSNSRSSVFALFFLCYFQTTPYPIFRNAFSSLSSSQGTFSPAIMALFFMCIITTSFWFDFYETGCISNSHLGVLVIIFSYFIKVGTFSSPPECSPACFFFLVDGFYTLQRSPKHFWLVAGV